MAKRRGRPPGSGKRRQASSDYENVMGRMRSWLQEREELANDLRALADSLSTAVVRAPPPSMAALQGAGSPTRKRAPMSAEARAKIAAAARARWAKQKQGGAAKKAKKAKSA